jgi:Cys-tRNA(Pro)/Cys-tRNA(Cys) deacylase
MIASAQERTMPTPKSLAMRRLDAARVPYDVLAYPTEIRDAAEVAAHLGVPPSQVYKTLVVQRAAGRPLLVLLAADRQVDLKGLAAALGEKKLQLAAHRDAERLTGLQVGGISALAVRDGAFDVVVDSAAGALDGICVSAGQRGLNVRVAVDALVRLTGARFVDAAASGESTSAEPTSTETSSIGTGGARPNDS